MEAMTQNGERRGKDRERHPQIVCQGLSGSKNTQVAIAGEQSR
jgi:hypothetical protein